METFDYFEQFILSISNLKLKGLVCDIAIVNLVAHRFAIPLGLVTRSTDFLFLHATITVYKGVQAS